jgi:hypothetical protein
MDERDWIPKHFYARVELTILCKTGQNGNDWRALRDLLSWHRKIQANSDVFWSIPGQEFGLPTEQVILQFQMTMNRDSAWWME